MATNFLIVVKKLLLIFEVSFTTPMEHIHNKTGDFGHPGYNLNLRLIFTVKELKDAWYKLFLELFGRELLDYEAGRFDSVDLDMHVLVVQKVDYQGQVGVLESIMFYNIILIFFEILLEEYNTIAPYFVIIILADAQNELH